MNRAQLMRPLCSISLACVMVEESTVGFLAAIVLLVTFGYVVTLVYECLSRSAITSVVA
jgi:hypothetical protein